jgi:hypothetical protein
MSGQLGSSLAAAEDVIAYAGELHGAHVRLAAVVESYVQEERSALSYLRFSPLLQRGEWLRNNATKLRLQTCEMRPKCNAHCDLEPSMFSRIRFEELLSERKRIMTIADAERDLQERP